MDHESVTMPRRQMRRPVAGGRPYSRPLPILEHQPTVPVWLWCAIGAGVVAASIAAASYVACAVWLDRQLRS